MSKESSKLIAILMLMIVIPFNYSYVKAGYNDTLTVMEDHTQLVRSVVFSNDGKYLASGSFDNTVKLWHAETGECISTFKGHSGSVWCVAFSPDNKYIASASDDHTVKLWSIRNSECVRTFYGHTGWVHTVGFSPDGRRLITGAGDRSMRLWEVESGKCVRKFQLVVGWVLSAAFSPSGEYLVSSGLSESIKVWRVSDGKLVKVLKGHKDYINSVCYSQDGKHIASGSDDNTIRIWSTETGKCVKTLMGDMGRVYSVSFAPYGQCVVSGSCDQKLRLWSFVTGECLTEFNNHSDFVYSVSFSPSGETIASGGGDKAVTLWKNPLYGNLYTIKDNVELCSSTGKVITKLPLNTRVKVAILKGDSLYVAASQSLTGWVKQIDVAYEKQDTMVPSVQVFEKSFDEPYLYIKGAAYDDKKITSVRIGSVELTRKGAPKRAEDLTDVYMFESVVTVTPDTKLVLSVDDSAGNTSEVPIKIEETIIDYTPRFARVKAVKDINVMEKPDKTSKTFFKVEAQTSLTSLGRKGAWLCLEGGGWVKEDFVAECKIGDAYDQLEVLTLVPEGFKTAPQIPKKEIVVGKDIPEGLANPDAIAVVIGIRDYKSKEVPRVKYALNDARTVKQYLTKTLGYREGNIIYAENPTKADFERIFGTKESFKGQLYNYVKAKKSDVFVYYTGHGAPGLEEKVSYFVPSDCHSDYVELSGYSMNQFYRNLSKIPAKNITVVMDACFSGASEGGSLARLSNPIALVHKTKIPSNITVFTSASNTELASWYPQKGHSLFTYFFLKGLHGAANSDGNETLTFGELDIYVSEEVSYLARRLYGRKQTPRLTGRRGASVVTYISINRDFNKPINGQLQSRKKCVVADLSANLKNQNKVGGDKLTRR